MTKWPLNIYDCRNEEEYHMSTKIDLKTPLLYTYSDVLYFQGSFGCPIIRMKQTSEIISNDTKESLPNITVFCMLLTLIFLSLNGHQVTAWGRHSVEDLNCEEAPPNCHLISLTQVENVDHFTYNGSSTVYSVRYLINSSSSHHVCSLNPLDKTPSLRNTSSVVAMSITCSQPGTRIVITNRSEYIMSSVILSLWINNCTMYWKDLSKIGRLFVLYGITLHDWQDEFMTRSISIHVSKYRNQEGSATHLVWGVQLLDALP